METIKYLFIGLLGCLMYSTVQADQAQLVSKKEANAALAFLKTENINVIKKFCLPCGDELPENILIDSMSIQDGNYKGLWELLINGQEIDLAYVYVPTQGRWKNFARVVDIYVDDMPKYLENIPFETKIAESKGWYINKKPKVIMSKEVNQGTFIALLGRGQYVKPSVFFKGSTKGCGDDESEKAEPTPMYVNDTLVKLNLVCKGEATLFFADTEESNEFVLEQFITQPAVKLRPYSGEDSFIFSSKGFEELYKKVTENQ